MLFQNYALFDFLSVASNVAFPLEQRGGMTADAIEANASPSGCARSASPAASTS